MPDLEALYRVGAIPPVESTRFHGWADPLGMPTAEWYDAPVKRDFWRAVGMQGQSAIQAWRNENTDRPIVLGRKRPLVGHDQGEADG